MFYSFQTASAKLDAPAPPPLLGGLDYIKTEIVSVPVLHEGQINGYFLTRLVYTVEPELAAKLSVPAESLIIYDLNESGNLGAIAVLGLMLLAVSFAVVFIANRVPLMSSGRVQPRG